MKDIINTSEYFGQPAINLYGIFHFVGCTKVFNSKDA